MRANSKRTVPAWLTRQMAASARPKTPREDWPAAYARVGATVGLSADDVRKAWRDWQRLGVQADFEGPAYLRAIELLLKSEAQLAGEIQQAIKFANTLVRMKDGYPRFLHYHTWSSVHSASGFPDSIMVDRLRSKGFVWELKRESSLPDRDQALWLEALAALGGTWEVLGVVYPSTEHLVRRAVDL